MVSKMKLFDKEDEEGVVDDNFTKFQAMYHPIIENKFKDIIHLDNGQVQIDPKGSKQLLLNVNDNVYKNIEHFSLPSFDPNSAIHKNAISIEEKSKIAD